MHADVVVSRKRYSIERSLITLQLGAKIAKEPQRCPHSGRIVFRVAPEVRHQAAVAAELMGKPQWEDDVLAQATHIHLLPISACCGTQLSCVVDVVDRIGQSRLVDLCCHFHGVPGRAHRAYQVGARFPLEQSAKPSNMNIYRSQLDKNIGGPCRFDQFFPAEDLPR